VEVVSVPDDLVIKPAQDIVATPQTKPKAATLPDKTSLPDPPIAADADTAKPVKHGFFQRINPANLFHHEPKNTSQFSPAPLAPTVIPSPAPLDISEPTKVQPIADNVVASTRPTAPPVQIWPHYTYKSPAKPAPGNRNRAQAYFDQALQAQREGRTKDAVAEYRTAAQLDPAFFEAQANLGLAEYDLGEMEPSLVTYETALALRPDSTRTRFSFALALRKAGYFLDSAQEFERVLSASPDDASAHLALANLYAEQFHQPQAARQHYLRVLAIDPHNPQATDIRFWLNENP
jgi:Tfp pilus assembly protein PilF